MNEFTADVTAAQHASRAQIAPGMPMRGIYAGPVEIDDLHRLEGEWVDRTAPVRFTPGIGCWVAPSGSAARRVTRPFKHCRPDASCRELPGRMATLNIGGTAPHISPHV